MSVLVEFYLNFGLPTGFSEVLKHLDKSSIERPIVSLLSSDSTVEKNHRLKPVSEEKRRIRRSEGRNLSA